MTWRTPVGLMSFQGGPSSAGGRTRSRATGGALGIGGMTGRSPHSTRMRKGEARRRPPSARPCAPSRGFDTAPAATPAPETASTRPPRKKRGRNGFYNLRPVRSLDPRIWKGRALPYAEARRRRAAAQTYTYRQLVSRSALPGLGQGQKRICAAPGSASGPCRRPRYVSRARCRGVACGGSWALPVQI